MQILHLTPSYFPALIYGGPTLSVSRLCEAQILAEARVRVLTTTANGPVELDVPTGVPQDVNGVEVFYYPRLTKDHTHFSPQLLVQIWKQCRQFDVVHIHSWWNPQQTQIPTTQHHLARLGEGDKFASPWLKPTSGT
ncbi:MAG: glycosyltransferase [Saprospirales bacterium]|nr:glycosyltransferase [Saprospirales bacterium]